MIDVLVHVNEDIEEGDVIATLNMATVMSSLADVQAEIDDLADCLRVM